MKLRTWTAVTCALALAGCAGTGPQLSYPEFLPNTNENPAWARTTAEPLVPQDTPTPRNTAPTR